VLDGIHINFFATFFFVTYCLKGNDVYFYILKRLICLTKEIKWLTCYKHLTLYVKKIKSNTFAQKKKEKNLKHKTTRWIKPKKNTTRCI